MSRRLRLAVVAALAVALPCAASEPVGVPAAAPPTASTPGVEAPPPAEVDVAAPLAIFTPLTPAPPVASVMPPLMPPLRLPPRLEPAPATGEAQVEPSGPPATVAGTPALRSGQDVFARLRRGLAPNACNAGSNSARWRERYAGSPAAFSRRIESVLPLIDFVGAEVERAGLPAEFTFIPLVESWYQPGAVGPGGPAGMWQMIASTAKNHGIHIRDGYDGRLSPVESTRAALSYLRVLKGMFGDWQAIVMAYNAGEGRLQHALRRAGSRAADASKRKPHGLSNITYDYVDKLQALSCLVLQPERQGLRLPVDARFEPLVPLMLDEDIGSLEQFASTHGKDAPQLRRLNPGFRNGRIVAGVPRLVLAPASAAAPRPEAPVETLDPTLVAQAQPPASMPDGIAGQESSPLLFGGVGVDPVLVPAALPPTEVPLAAPAPDASPAPAPNPDPPVHEVRAGDTVGSIATHYQLPVEQILRANHLSRDALLRPGQKLRLVP